MPLPLHRTSPPSQPLQKNDNPLPRTKLASLVKGRWLDGKAQALTLCIYLRYAHHFYIANFSAAKTEGLSHHHLFAPAPKIIPCSLSERNCSGVCRNAVVWVGASLRRLCATAIVHPLHVYERSACFASALSHEKRQRPCLPCQREVA